MCPFPWFSPRRAYYKISTGLQLREEVLVHQVWVEYLSCAALLYLHLDRLLLHRRLQYQSWLVYLLIQHRIRHWTLRLQFQHHQHMYQGWISLDHLLPTFQNNFKNVIFEQNYLTWIRGRKDKQLHKQHFCLHQLGQNLCLSLGSTTRTRLNENSHSVDPLSCESSHCDMGKLASNLASEVQNQTIAPPSVSPMHHSK